MTITTLEGLCRCKKCGSKDLVLRRDSSKKFQVWCNNCHNHTRWQKKTETVIEWFNQ